AIRPSSRQPAIPLPSIGSAPTGSKPLGASSPAGSSSGLATSPGMPFARTPSAPRAGAVPLPGGAATRVAPPPAAVPLPGADPSTDPGGDDLDFADADLVEPPNANTLS